MKTNSKFGVRARHTAPRNSTCRGVHIHTPALTCSVPRSAVQAGLLLALAEFAELGWSMPSESFRLVVDRLTAAGHITHQVPADGATQPMSMVWRTPRSASTEPPESRPAQAIPIQWFDFTGVDAVALIQNAATDFGGAR
ncbi:hypothetical protein [Kitasatospora griseola]|uniref:hypothetical protein n=1 Tax=Kitasatospora griseola TaxID=2064 RepID=UPI003822EE7F